MKIIMGLFRLLLEEFLNGFRIKIHGISYCISSGVKFWIHKGSTCDLGKKTWLSENCILGCNGGEITLGYNNFFNTNCRVACQKKIIIGDNNLFGPNVIIVDHNHAYSDKNKLICKQGFNSNPIIIGSNVWIGGNVPYARVLQLLIMSLSEPILSLRQIVLSLVCMPEIPQKRSKIYMMKESIKSLVFNIIY